MERDLFNHFQAAQPDPAISLGRHGQYPEDLTLLIDPGDPRAAVTELPSAANLLGPALRVPGVLRAKPPMFAAPAANNLQAPEQQADALLLPFANQGTLRGDYAVFMNYTRPEKP